MPPTAITSSESEPLAMIASSISPASTSSPTNNLAIAPAALLTTMKPSNVSPIGNSSHTSSTSKPTISATHPKPAAICAGGSQLESLPPEIRLEIYHYLGFPVDPKYKYRRHPALCAMLNLPELLESFRLDLTYDSSVMSTSWGKTGGLCGRIYLAAPVFCYGEKPDSAKNLFAAQLMRVSSLFAKDFYPVVYNGQVMLNTKGSLHKNPSLASTYLISCITSLNITTYDILLQLDKEKGGFRSRDLESVVKHFRSLKELRAQFRVQGNRSLGVMDREPLLEILRRTFALSGTLEEVVCKWTLLRGTEKHVLDVPVQDGGSRRCVVEIESLSAPRRFR